MPCDINVKKTAKKYQITPGAFQIPKTAGSLTVCQQSGTDPFTFTAMKGLPTPPFGTPVISPDGTSITLTFDATTTDQDWNYTITFDPPATGMGLGDGSGTIKNH